MSAEVVLIGVGLLVLVLVRGIGPAVERLARALEVGGSGSLAMDYDDDLDDAAPYAPRPLPARPPAPCGHVLHDGLPACPTARLLPPEHGRAPRSSTNLPLFE